MDQANPTRIPLTRTLVALVAVFTLLHLAGAHDWLSELTRPAVVGLLKLLGLGASVDASGQLIVGRLRVPWTRDCAGLNILMTLWAVTLWVNRAEVLSRRFWLRLALGVPAAYLANLARIFTLIGYRQALFPNVESPQLHYFIGFLWLMPCLSFFVPRAGRAFGQYLVETLFFVTALSLVSPFVQAPGGSLVTLSTLLLLATAGLDPARWRGRLWLFGGWVAAAVFIGSANMESLWLPWLLLCPLTCPPASFPRPSRWGLLAGTIPLVSMHPVARWLVLLAAAVEIFKLVRPASAAAPAPPARELGGWLRFALPPALGLVLVLPFFATTLNALLRPSLRPPPGVMAREVGPNTFDLRLVGQPHNLELTWFGPSGDGRHHHLAVCMRYRDVTLRPCDLDPSVMTDGHVWMREFFLQDGRLIPDYQGYLQRTFLPWSSAGVHLIAAAPCDTVSARIFAETALQIVTQLSRLDQSAAISSLKQPL